MRECCSEGSLWEVPKNHLPLAGIFPSKSPLRFPSLHPSKRQKALGWLPQAASPYAQLPLLGQMWPPRLLTPMFGSTPREARPAKVTGRCGQQLGPDIGCSPSCRDKPCDAKPVWQWASYLCVCSGPFYAIPVLVVLGQHHTLTEQLELAGISKGPLVQVPGEERATLSQMDSGLH